jgi:DNA-binding CsgD family transcriptional regulator
VHHFYSESDDSVRFYLRKIQDLSIIHESVSHKIRLNNLLSAIELRGGNRIGAYKIYLENINLCDKSNDSAGLVMSYFNISQLFGSRINAKNYLNKAQSVYDDISSTKELDSKFAYESIQYSFLNYYMVNGDTAKAIHHGMLGFQRLNYKLPMNRVHLSGVLLLGELKVHSPDEVLYLLNKIVFEKEIQNSPLLYQKVQISRAQMFLLKGDLDLAYTILMEVYPDIMIGKSLNLKLDVCLEFKNYYEALHDYRLTLEFSERIDSIDVIYEKEASVNEMIENELLNKFSNQVDSLEARHFSELYTNDKQIEVERGKYFSLLFVLGLIVLGSIGLFIIIMKRSKLINQLKRKFSKSENKLVIKQSEVTEKSLQLASQGEFFNDFVSEIEGVLKQYPEGYMQAKRLIGNKTFKDQPSNWIEFKQQFTELNSEFHKILTTKHPRLTINEKRLCYFMKMEMSTKEISELTKQSESSIFMARNRLRKKMGLVGVKKSIPLYLNELLSASS